MAVEVRVNEPQTTHAYARSGVAVWWLGALGFEAGYYYLRACGRIAWAIYPEIHPLAIFSVVVGAGLLIGQKRCQAENMSG